MVKIFIYLTISCFLSLVNCFAQEKDSIEYIGIIIVEDMPVFKGNLNEFVQNNLRHPESAKSDSVYGLVFVSFWVDTIGNTINHIIIRGIRQDLDEEALRVARLIKFDKPAMQRGKPIRVKYNLPVEFKLPTKNEPKNKGCKK